MAASTADNKAIIRRYFREVVNERNLDAIDQLVALSAENQCGGTSFRGPSAWRASTQQVATSFPDMQVTIEGMVAEGNLVAVRWTGRGTHRGEFMGIPATGKAVPMSNLDLFRVENGQITAAWSFPDMMPVMRALGVSGLARFLEGWAEPSADA